LLGTELFAVYAFSSLTGTCVPPLGPPLFTVAPHTLGGVEIGSDPGHANRSGSRVSLQIGCALLSAASPV